MNAAKTAMGASAATGTAAMAGTKPAAEAVPFLDVPLFIITINGIDGMVTPQAAIFTATGVLSLAALIKALLKKG